MIYDPNIPPPDWMSKEALITTITERVPVEYVLSHSSRIRALYEPGIGWNTERLNACTEWDLIQVFRLVDIKEQDCPDE